MSQKEIDHAIRTTFRNLPILASEDREQYEDVKRLVLSDIKPCGLQEILLARDILEDEWEVRRLRWMKVATLHAVLLRVIKSRILEAGGTRSLDRRLVQKISKHVAARRSTGTATARNAARKLQADGRPHHRCRL